MEGCKMIVSLEFVFSLRMCEETCLAELCEMFMVIDASIFSRVCDNIDR